MKKRTLCFLMALLICLATAGNTLALAHDSEAPQPRRGAITLYCGLDNFGNGNYRARATIETGGIETLSVNFTLYKVVNGSEQFVTSGSKSNVVGTEATASKIVALSSGTYRIYYSGSGNTVSDSDSSDFFVR